MNDPKRPDDRDEADRGAGGGAAGDARDAGGRRADSRGDPRGDNRRAGTAWRSLSNEEPPAALDAALRAAARREVGARVKPAAVPEATRPERWWFPLAAAATIGAIAIGLLQVVMPERMGEPGGDARSVSDVPPGAKSVEMPAAEPTVPPPAPAARPTVPPAAPAAGVTAEADGASRVTPPAPSAAKVEAHVPSRGGADVPSRATAPQASAPTAASAAAARRDGSSAAIPGDHGNAVGRAGASGRGFTGCRPGAAPSSTSRPTRRVARPLGCRSPVAGGECRADGGPDGQARRGARAGRPRQRATRRRLGGRRSEREPRTGRNRPARGRASGAGVDRADPTVARRRKACRRRPRAEGVSRRASGSFDAAATRPARLATVALSDECGAESPRTEGLSRPAYSDVSGAALSAPEARRRAHATRLRSSTRIGAGNAASTASTGASHRTPSSRAPAATRRTRTRSGWSVSR